jgi:hypothetical protein
MLIGGRDGAGLGNILIFFPSVFYFAAFTGRDILIANNSIMSEMCSIIQCGFPLMSQVAPAFPKLFTAEALSHIPDLRSGDFQAYFDGKMEIPQTLVRSAGFKAKSDWWVHFNSTVHCVKKITGCDLGDVMCAERHAYQRLVRGPFKTSLTEAEEKRIHGVPDYFKHSLLTLPHAYAPRLDVAIHLRNQFVHFEANTDPNDPSYKREVQEWLNSTECEQVFGAMESRLLQRIREIRPQAFNQSELESKAAEATIDSVYVFLASDNDNVKDAFCRRLQQNPSTSYLYRDVVRIMRVDTKAIYHVKHLAQLKSATNNEGVLDLVFDWYALSLSNSILAWRKGSSNMVSTFVHSAQKVSGTTERTDNALGRGIGTRGYQLMRDRRGNMYFDLFWAYTFLEDFLI